MPPRNGVNKKTNIKNRVSVAFVKRRRSSENSPVNPQKGFRGFNRVPRVLLSRYDITPYLNKQRKDNKFQKHMEVLQESDHAIRLAQKCFVKVINQDLEKLKHEYLSQRNCKISIVKIENRTDTVKCNFCEKTFANDIKLLKHQEKKHTLVFKTENKTQKRVSFSDHVIIHEVKEYHKCRKCPDIFEEYELLKKHIKQFHQKRADKDIEAENIVNVSNNELTTGVDDVKTEKTIADDKNIVENNIDVTKAAVIRSKPRKTLFSKHRCESASLVQYLRPDAEANCGKYLSSNYTLKRHIAKMHSDYNKLQCKVCEEIFFWPSLLKSHKCIRLNHPEMPFQDARPEIHFDNLNEISQNGFDDFNISVNDNYMNDVDFEIPEPIVDLTEDDFAERNEDRFAPLSNLGYKIIMQQEVPIEF